MMAKPAFCPDKLLQIVNADVFTSLVYSQRPRYDYLPLDEKHPCRPEDAYSAAIPRKTTAASVNCKQTHSSDDSPPSRGHSSFLRCRPFPSSQSCFPPRSEGGI